MKLRPQHTCLTEIKRKQKIGFLGLKMSQQKNVN